jgi:hypothetical protein
MEDEVLEQKQASSSKVTNKAQQYDILSLHRFVKNGKHFYTTNYNEGIANGYQYEGDLGLLYYPKPEFIPIPLPGNFYGPPILRWRHKTNGDRLITEGKDELLPMLYTNNYPFPDGYVHNGSPGGEWVYEGVIGYGSTDHVAPHTYVVYRYFNSSKNDHLFTRDINELGPNGKDGYVNQGRTIFSHVY